MDPKNASRPLDGIRVLEMGQLLAGPFAGCVLGYFGAEVIKIEPLRGDPIRGWREVRDGTSLWWASLARNKKSVTLDLQNARGRELAKALASKCDVLIENFRPGTMEKWGLGPAELKASNPELVYARVSGYGQTGPYAARPGYASVCEGFAGFRYLNGFADRAPVRPNISMGDTLAGLHAVLGILLALTARLRAKAPAGQVVDVAIYESVFNLLEAVVPEYDGAGLVREPSGSTITGIVPTNTYRCADGRYVIIGGNGDSIYQRLMRAIGRPEMAADPRYATNTKRVENEKDIDAAISAWTGARASEAVLAALRDADVPNGPIYNVADMMADPHFNARGMFETVSVGGKPLKIPAIPPLLGETPGRTDAPGPRLGAHTDEVLEGLLGVSAEARAELRAAGVI
jgi:crotonobetainyl-CoA:carnitine CoA-transferase CaiB-like acyl-CoA transferase